MLNFCWINAGSVSALFVAGIEQVFFDYLRTYDGGLQEMLTANQLPVGLVKINSRICVSSLW